MRKLDFYLESKFVRWLAFPGQLAHALHHVERVTEREDVAHPDRVSLGEVFDLALFVFFFVADEQVGAQGFYFLKVKRFGAADAGLGLKPFRRSDTKLGDTDHLVFQTQIGQKLRLRWHERDDSARRPMRQCYPAAHLIGEIHDCGIFVQSR